MKNYIRILPVILAAFISVTLPAYAAKSSAKNAEGIAIVVNQDAVSASDVRERMKLILASTGLPPTPELQEKLKPQVINMLIEEQLKVQEAQRLKMDVTQAEIDEGVSTVAKNNNMTGDQFKQMISSRGIAVKTLENQVKAQMAWSKVIAKSLRPRIEVTGSDIKAEQARLTANLGQTQYAVSEILLTANDAKQEPEVVATANRLVTQLRQQPEAFPRVAQQFSQAAGAAQGGAIGWLMEGQLDPALEAQLKTMQPGQISDPVKSLAGYHILLLREKRQITEELMPKEEEVLNRIGTERLERLQRRLLLDLRSSAFIETRV